jgi:hypothetical protein
MSAGGMGTSKTCFDMRKVWRIKISIEGSRDTPWVDNLRLDFPRFW